jgi:uncharacterized membrane protein YccC
MKIKQYFSTLRHWPFKYYRTIHSIKTALGCLLGVAIEKYYDLPSGQWIPITVMVVMSAQVHFGGALRKAYMRFLGTVSGIAITITTLWLFDNNLIAIFCVIFIVIMVFTYVASSKGDINYAGTLGGVTTLLTLTGQQVGIEIAMQRGLYIIIGIVIALVVSRVVFPIHARDRFRYHVATTLRNLQKLYLKITQMDVQLEQKTIDSELENVVATDIAINQPQLINEAVAGSRAFAAKKRFFTQIINSEHQLNRLIGLTYRNLFAIESPEIIKEYLATVGDLHAVIENNFIYLADCFENMESPEESADLNNAIQKTVQIVEKLPKKNEIHETITGYSLIFFMEQILKELKNINQLIKKVSGKNINSVI